MGVCVCVCVCVCVSVTVTLGDGSNRGILRWFEDARVLVYSTGIVQKELICGYASVVHTSSSFHTHTHTH